MLGPRDNGDRPSRGIGARPTDVVHARSSRTFCLPRTIVTEQARLAIVCEGPANRLLRSRRDVMLVPIDANIWTYEEPLSFYGLPTRHRMTVIRLAAGGLVLISPTSHTPELAAHLQTLGPIVAIVAPSWWHDLYLGDWAAANPDVPFYGAPKLVETHRRLNFREALEDESPALWAADIEQHHVLGIGLRADEIVFFHRASRTLVLTDIFLNYDANDAPITRAIARAIVSSKPGLAFPRFYRPFVDREPFRRSIERILTWDFQRIVNGHGANVERDAATKFGEAFAWLISSQSV